MTDSCSSCSIPGHSDAGMTGVIHTPGSAAAPSDEHIDATTADEVAADPDAPPYEWRDPAAPERGEGEGVTLVPGGADDGGDLIEVEMIVEEKLMTVAEGYQQLVWTFNGTVPGPVLRTEVGDTVRVHLVNPAEASASHSVDFHASQVAWNDEMRSIAPGEDLVYEFTTDYAGVWMYHCGTDPVLHHIANGMFGMVIVEPEGGLPPVDHEFFLVQNEWYLGPQGEMSSYAKANQAAPAPDFVMFNGVAFQYKDQPIEVPTGEDVRLFVLDVGPSIDSSFHIVGTIFHEVIKEGVHLVGRQRRQLGVPSGRPRPGARRDHRAHDRRGRALPDRDPCLQLPRARRPRPAAGRRRPTLTASCRASAARRETRHERSEPTRLRFRSPGHVERDRRLTCSGPCLVSSTPVPTTCWRTPKTAWR